MKVAILSPVAWRTPPRHYGPWEQVAFNIAEGLVKRGLDVTLFATKDSYFTGTLDGIIERGYEEDKMVDAKVAECMHISYLAEQANSFDIIHNNFDFLPLTYSGLFKTPMITTIHGFSSEKIIPVYKRFNPLNHYISISNADRHPSLQYLNTIYHGVQGDAFSVQEHAGKYLLYLGRIHPHKGAHDAVTIAKMTGMQLIIAGIIQDQVYFDEQIKPFIDGNQIVFEGHVGPQKRNELLGNALALLHPIYFNEPFGLSVVEAMFCGTPVVAYDKGSMPEIIVDGISGFLVNDIHEAVDRVNNIAVVKRKECAMYARDKFSCERMITAYMEVYDHACANPLK